VSKEKKENMEQAPVLTLEDVQKGLKEANERASKLPHINTVHLVDIENFIQAHIDVKTEDEANEVLTYFDSLKDEWKEYYKLQSSYTFPNIYICIANAYIALNQKQMAIEELEKCMSCIAHAKEYQYLFVIISDIYYWLANLYYDVENLERVRSCIREGVHHLLIRDNHTSYENYAFYAFRPLRDYVLEGIRDNKISFADPTTFNDPVDPALFKHLESLIASTNDDREKNMLRFELETYKNIRIASLCRTYPLPTDKEDDIYEADPPYKAITKASMWGYYASSHTGICIKYVFPSSFTSYDPQDKSEVIILRNVNYLESYNPNKDTFSYDEAFFSKGKDWKNECECRLAYFKEEGEVDTFQWKELPDDCIQEIYIGYAASKEDKSKLKEALENRPNIRLFQMKLSANNLFELEPVPISRDDIEDVDLTLWQRIKNRICSFTKSIANNT
jgi:hypothetical protein